MWFRFWLQIKQIPRYFKWTHQYLTRGFSDRQTWGLDTTIAKFVLPRLIRFKQVNNGYPHDLTEEKWDEYLDLMIFALDACASEKKFSAEANEIDWDKVNKGLELFGRHMMSLWW